jgi:hypothetical protein
MASLISSTSWGGGMAGGPLRCSVCGRREAAVEHLVRARLRLGSLGVRHELAVDGVADVALQ